MKIYENDHIMKPGHSLYGWTLTNDGNVLFKGRFITKVDGHPAAELRFSDNILGDSYKYIIIADIDSGLKKYYKYNELGKLIEIPISINGD